VSVLLVDRSGTVERWQMNRPHVRNALDLDLVTALQAALDDAESRGSDVIVLSGAGRSFCAGADLQQLAEHYGRSGRTPRELLTAIWDFTLALERSPIVVVAALHGHAVAGGLELALACDVVVASEETLIGDGHVKHCLVAGGGASARMERALGRSTSAWLALTGELLPATAPDFATWLRRVRPASDLEHAVDDVVATLTSVPAAARGRYKQMLHEAGPSPSAAARDAELDAFDEHWVLHDVPAAIRGFLHKNRRTA